MDMEDDRHIKSIAKYSMTIQSMIQMLIVQYLTHLYHAATAHTAKSML